MKPNFALSLLALVWTAAAAFAQNPAPKTGAPSPKAVSKAVSKAPKSALQTHSLAQLNPRGESVPNNPVAAAILNAERNQDANSLLLAYGQAVTDSELARAAISQLLASYYLMRNGAQTAEQATQAVAEANLRFQVLQAAQNQVMVQQNQQLLQQNTQIIALLQRQTRPAKLSRRGEREKGRTGDLVARNLVLPFSKPRAFQPQLQRRNASRKLP